MLQITAAHNWSTHLCWKPLSEMELRFMQAFNPLLGVTQKKEKEGKPQDAFGVTTTN
jgi:hypothetical protein